MELEARRADRCLGEERTLVAQTDSSHREAEKDALLSPRREILVTRVVVVAHQTLAWFVKAFDKEAPSHGRLLTSLGHWERKQRIPPPPTPFFGFTVGLPWKCSVWIFDNP